MKASINWLREYVDLGDKTPREIADKLTMIGLEVEDLRDRFAFLNKVVTAKLTKVEDLDGGLRLCRAEAGIFGKFQVVCGAPNAREGLVTALVLPDTTLPGGQFIKTAERRGHVSEGMFCSEAELAIGEEADRIMELSDAPGRTLKDITGQEEWVMEIGITPNRPDALSIIGLARDLSAALGRSLKQPQFAVDEKGPLANGLASVEIEAVDHAYRYTARVITGVAIGPSPFWLVDRLASVGIRSINNVVDVTNYVMMEMGLPLHAFDLDVLADHRIVVKMYKNGEKLTTLDGQERELKAAGGLMICDGQKAIGLAGIMGALNSEITSGTTSILLEGACFNSTTIRRTSRSLGLSTDASYRFERGCDPEICPVAVDRAADLMAQLGGGQVAQGRLDNYPRPYKPISVPFSPEKCNAFLGTKHRTEDMIKSLTAIGLEMKPAGPQYSAILPSWRPDLHREVDVWEEVARLLDFDSLPATLPAPPKIRKDPPPAWTLREKVRDYLTANGFSETVTYSFINPNFADKLSVPAKSVWRQRQVRLINPLSEEHLALRPLMTPSLLNSLKYNQHQGARQVAIFEAAAVVLSNGPNKQPDENQTIGGLWAGAVGLGNWCGPERSVDFWDVKGLLEGLADHLGLTFTFARNDSLPQHYNAAEAAVVSLENGSVLGHVGRLNQEAAKAFGLKEIGGPVYLFELDGEEILKIDTPALGFHSWARYPAVDRDLALVLNKEITAGSVSDLIGKRGDWPLTKLLIFDLYQGNQLPADKKSLALRLTFQSAEKTLTDEEVSGYCQEITQRLVEKFGATLRA